PPLGPRRTPFAPREGPLADKPQGGGGAHSGQRFRASCARLSLCGGGEPCNSRDRTERGPKTAWSRMGAGGYSSRTRGVFATAQVLDLMVGAARFELATPSPPDWCANQAALRSDARRTLAPD